MADEAAPDYEKLVDYFRALAYPTRLELLHLLRFPHALPDIRLTPRQTRPGQNPDRPVARQTVQEHLEHLLAIGVVTAREPDGPKGRKEFVVNGAKVYQMMEELRRVGTIVVGAPVGGDATVARDAGGGAVKAPQEQGPRLVLVHGLYEGKAFPLRRAGAGPARWVLGRKAEAAVSLDYDPYVSGENAAVEQGPGGFALVDLPGSRNGTLLNWRTLAPGERAPLRSGDVIGVGRSLLVFRAD